MSRLSARSFRATLALGVAGMSWLSSAAYAQDALPPTAVSPGSKDTGAGSEIVVTGTSLRKVAPAGAESITLGPTQIAATNAISTDQLLATLPQLNSFGALQTVNSGGIQETVNQTNIRNLPQGVGGGSPTLVLMDGHRIVGMGVKQSYPDPDIVPPALIDRVEVLTDGGSAIYGADAIGGVVNIITKRDFSGIDVSAREGLGQGYHSTDVNFTVGKAWTGGDFYVGYNLSYHSPIWAADRSYVKNIDYATGLPNNLYCSPANAVVNGSTYAVTGSGSTLTAGNGNLCDNSREGTIYPREMRNSVLFGFRQELTSNLELEIKGYYSQRDDTAPGNIQTGSATVNSGDPYYIPFAGNPAETVYFDFSKVGGNENVTTNLHSWGITPTLTWKFGHDWQMKAYYNHGESHTVVNDPGINDTVLANDIAAGTIDPYNIANSNAAALGDALNYTNYGVGKDQLDNVKATFDGPLLRLPGGELRVAVGGEYIHEYYEGTTVEGTAQAVAIAPLSPAGRHVESGFAEANIPVVGPDNHIPLIYSFNISAAERFDHYSDFGSNWAPNIGATLKPISWIGLRARWNRAFQAPSLVQISQATTPTVSTFPAYLGLVDPYLINPAVTFNDGPIVAVQGTVSPLQPERARDYNLGFDMSPPVVPGLNLHFTYWNIDYSGQIGTPPYGYGTFFGVSTYNPLYIMLPSIAQVQSFLQNASVPASVIQNTVASINAQGGNAYIVADVRSRNLGVSKVHGVDMSFDYRHPTGFGAVFASFNSSWTLHAVTAPDGVDFLANTAGVDGSAFNSVGIVGASVGKAFRAQVTWNHLSGFALSQPPASGQTSVNAFNTFDFYAQYTVKRGSLPPVNLSLGITNMFNTDPPVYRGDASAFGAGYAHSTLGRVFQLGADIKI
jgi:iron complex outermembrane recepter protein